MASMTIVNAPICIRPIKIPIKTERPRLTIVKASETLDGPMRKPRLSDAEWEAAVVAGNVPKVPPVPAAPAGTAVVPPLPLSRRPRRNRKSPALRKSFQETKLSPENFVYSLFIHEGEEDTPIETRPGCFKFGWRNGLLEEVSKARDVGVNSIVLFSKVTNGLKTPARDDAFNENDFVPRAIRLVRDKYPDLVIYSDISLEPYSSDAQDDIVREDEVVMNDETMHQLCKQAVAQARAGADVVSPSDMMDGRVGAIRAALDAEGFQDVSIMSYSVNYQMNGEDVVESCEDESEEADILLVKPGMLSLDIIRFLRDSSPLLIAAHQVSGEYSMIKAGGVLNEERAMMESLMGLRRAGANIILTHFALEAARCLCGEKR